MKLDHLITLCTRKNSKFIKYLSVGIKTIKILEENIDSKILDISCSNIFSDMSPWARKTHTNTKWDYIKLKSFCTAKKTINKIKRQPNEWENVFANDTSDNGLIPNNFKELIKINTKGKKKKNTQSK